MDKTIKVLHVVGHLGNGGDTTAIMNVYRYILKNELCVKFDFVTHNGCDLGFVGRLRNIGSVVHILKGDVHDLGIIQYYKEIYKILKNTKYDVVHCHTSFQSFITLLVAKKCKINIRVCHSHTTAVQHKINLIKRAIYLPICRTIINRLSTCKIACSKEAGLFLFGKKDKFNIVHNGVDINKIRNIDDVSVKKIKSKINFNDGDIILGQVGRFDENKNQIFSMEILRELPKNYKLVFLGQNNYIDEKKYSDDNIYFEGRVNNVQDYMSLFDYMLLPSKFGEGLPSVIIEQQIVNANTKCIVSNIVTKECDIGNVIFLDLDKKLWVDNILNTCKNSNVDISSFDINKTSIKWLSCYQ